MKKILLHQCCGPCSIVPINKMITDEKFEPVLYFFNPNIHPITEFYKRLETAITVAKKLNIKYYYDDTYDIADFITKILPNLDNRCSICYYMRLEKTCQKAKEIGIDTITTSILYSKMQKHDLVMQIGEELATKYQLNFYYEDFRLGWQEGIDKSKELELYRQNYCGCIFSEEERFKEQLKKRYNFQKQA